MWLPSKCRRLTPIQQGAIRHTFNRRNTLILAPTGSGKTLAAFLSVLNRLLVDPGSQRCVRAVYVSPLKALGRDIARNLEEPLAELNASLPESRRIRAEVRTGDTSPAERARMQRRPPHILLTTPESLSSLLSQSGWQASLRPDCVIVDEIHALAEQAGVGRLIGGKARHLPPSARLQMLGQCLKVLSQFRLGADPGDPSAGLVVAGQADVVGVVEQRPPEFVVPCRQEANHFDLAIDAKPQIGLHIAVQA